MKIKSGGRLFLLGLFLLSLLKTGVLGCAGSGNDGNLDFPFIPTIDSTSNRLFVIDNQFNGLNLINTLTDDIVEFDGESLLDEDDAQLLPLFPNQGVVAPLQNGGSRLFVSGGGVAPTNQIIVLDFDPAGTIQPTNFSPIPVPGSNTDILSGLVIDDELQTLFVSNATTGMIHAFDILSGVEESGSPIAVGGVPGRLSLDTEINLLVVSNSAGNTVSFIDPQNFATPVRTLDVGIPTRDVALASNSSGEIFFINGLNQNTARVFRLNLADLAASDLVFQLNPPNPSEPIPDPNFLTGNLNRVTAGRLTDNRLAAFYTQSSGDLLALDITSDLNNITPAIITIGAISGEGIDRLLDASGDLTKVYFASPGIGSVTVIDPLTNQFTDQIQ